jgi:hypothetical protein
VALSSLPPQAQSVSAQSALIGMRPQALTSMRLLAQEVLPALHGRDARDGGA